MQGKQKGRIRLFVVLYVIMVFFTALIPSNIVFGETTEDIGITKGEPHVVNGQKDVNNSKIENQEVKPEDIPEEISQRLTMEPTKPIENKRFNNSIVMRASSSSSIKAYIKYLNRNTVSKYDGKIAGEFNVTYNGKTYRGYCTKPGQPAPRPGTYTFQYWGSENGIDWYGFSPFWSNRIYDADPVDQGKIVGVMPYQLQGVVFGIPRDSYAKVKKIAVNNRYDPDKHSIAGAWYRLYENYGDAKALNNNHIKSMHTDVNGDSDVVRIDVGKTYYIRESKAPDGFMLDSNIYKVKGVSGKTHVITSKDVLKPGLCMIQKSSSKDEKLIKLCPEQYSLKNAKYAIYGSTADAKADRNRISVFVTDENGETETQSFTAGVYFIKEIEAPKGFKLDETVHRVVLRAGEKKVFKCTDEPQFDSLNMALRKKAEKKSKAGLSVEGAEYTVKYYKEYITQNQVDTAKPFRTWLFKTDKNGDIFLNEKYKIGGDQLFKNKDGKVVGLKGTYTFQETKAPKGYAITEGLLKNHNGQTVNYVDEEKNTKKLTILKDIHDLEKEQKAIIRIKKKDSETKENKPQGKYGGSLEGARYKVYYVDPKMKKDIFVGHIITDKNGEGKIENLKMGKYKIIEDKPSLGYIIDEKIHEVNAVPNKLNVPFFYYDVHSYEKPITIEVVKVGYDKSGVKTRIPGAELVLLDSKGNELEKWTTGDQPKVIKALPPGDYIIKETKAPKGYLNLEEPFKFTVDNKGKGSNTFEIFNEIIPEMETEAMFDNNVKSCIPGKKQRAFDIVSCKGLNKGEQYRIEGELVCKETGETVAYSERKFIANGFKNQVKMTYEFNAEENTTLVAFERLYKGDRLLAKHENLEDLNQTVTVPSGSTEAMDIKDGGKNVFAGEKETIVDVVRFEKLFAGKEYKLTGVLMDKSTKKPIRDRRGKILTSEKTFIPEGEKGTVVSGTTELKFNVDLSMLKGKTIVAFETVTENGQKVFCHTDIDDKNQSLYVPELRTMAKEKTLEAKTVKPEKEIVIADKVNYSNIIENQKYLIKGQLIRKKDGSILGENEKTFKAERNEGTVNLDIKADLTSLSGEDVVVFEKLYSIDEEGNVIKKVAEHTDINSKNQTVHVSKPIPVTGDPTKALFYLIAGGIAITLIVTAVKFKKSKLL